MKLSKLLRNVEHLGFVEAHDAPGSIWARDGFRAKTRQAWAAATKERAPGNRGATKAAELAKAESARMGEIDKLLGAAYAKGRRRAMEPGPELTARIPDPPRARRMKTRGFVTVRNGLSKDEWDAIPVTVKAKAKPVTVKAEAETTGA